MLQCKPKENIELHSDPENLNFYLIEDEIGSFTFDIIKKKSIESVFGNIEMAIIGSSHYLKLSNQFTEIITCSTEEISKSERLLVSERGVSDFSYLIEFSTFKYKLNVETILLEDSVVFKKFEDSLLIKKDIFAHKFYDNSAITALQYESKGNVLEFKSWHTYPQHNKVIYSRTELLPSPKIRGKKN